MHPCISASSRPWVTHTSHGATIIADVKASQTLFDRIAELGGKPLMWKTCHSLIRASNTQDVLVARAEARDQAALDRLIGEIDAELTKSGVKRTEAAH